MPVSKLKFSPHSVVLMINIPLIYDRMFEAVRAEAETWPHHPEVTDDDIDREVDVIVRRVMSEELSKVLTVKVA